MKDPYLYPHTDILKNLADIRDREGYRAWKQNIRVYGLRNL